MYLCIETLHPNRHILYNMKITRQLRSGNFHIVEIGKILDNNG